VLDPPDATRELARLRAYPEYCRERYASAIIEELIAHAREFDCVIERNSTA